MSRPLDHLKVVEMGAWVAGPAVGGIMADWGAEVVKIEPHSGDPMRGIFTAASGVDLGSCPPFELDNRGKRSIAIDAKSAEGIAVILELIDRADIFVTNLRPPALQRMGLDWPDLRVRNPRLIYGRITGYGEKGADANRPGYDVGAFWARAGIARALSAPDHHPPVQRGGMGDHTTAQGLLCGILAALHGRERTGRGEFVSTSLLRAGVYFHGMELSTAMRVPNSSSPGTRWGLGNPTMTFYRAGCGGWMQFLGLEGDRHWPGFCRAIGKQEWIDDEKYASLALRRKYNEEIVAALDIHFAQRTRDEWAEVLDRDGVWWTPMLTNEEVLQDPQAEAAGAFVDLSLGDGTTVRSVASPANFEEAETGPTGSPPEIGQHTEEILLELGYDWDKISALREAGVLP